MSFALFFSSKLIITLCMRVGCVFFFNFFAVNNRFATQPITVDEVNKAKEINSEQFGE